MKKFVCSICGFSIVAEEAPLICPVCNMPQDKFFVDEDEDEDKK